MSYFTSLMISGSALQVERTRVDLSASNLANRNATRSAEGGPYRRRDAALRSVPIEGAFGSQLNRALRSVQVSRVIADPRPPREISSPGHPDADANGMLRLPNVNLVEEVVNLRTAQRSYEANLQVMRASRDMALRALRIGRTS